MEEDNSPFQRLRESKMSETTDLVKLPDRKLVQARLEAAIAGKRNDGQLTRDDWRFISRVMRLLRPLFDNAEKRGYPLHERWRLKKSGIARTISLATDTRVRQVEYVSFSAPVPRQEWMTDEAYAYYLEVGFAHAVFRAVGPWFDAALRESHRPKFAFGHADLGAAEDLFAEAFGNTLHVAVNSGLFSGAANQVTVPVIHFIAFALTGNEYAIEPLIPLMRLLPRAIPLGKRSDREDTWIVLVA